MPEHIVDLGDTTGSGKKQRSGLATASLICSLIFCCPVITFIGVILGIVALLKLRGSEIAGRGLAWAGIFIGALTTLFSILVITFVLKAAMNILEQTPKIVTQAIEAGIAGEIELFREEFVSGAVAASDEEIATFVQTLTSRYGTFDEAVIDIAAAQSGSPLSGDELPLQLVFETKTVSATVVILVMPKGDPLFEVQIQCLRITDVQNGDIAFPLKSQCGLAISPTTDEE